MKKYLVIFKQEGEGCDYTIGCGYNFEEVEANTMHEALIEAMENMGWHDYYLNPDDYTQDPWSCENQMKYVKVYEIAQEDRGVLFQEYQKQMKEKFENAKDKKEKAREVSELARLAQKYNKTII